MALSDFLYEKTLNNGICITRLKSGFSASDLILPDGVTELGEDALAEENFVTVTLPASLKRIGDGAFWRCKRLKKVIFAAGCAPTYVGNRAFGLCESLESIELPVGLRTVADFAFDACTTLREVKLPAGVKKMGAEVFADCENLERVLIAENKVPFGWDETWLDCCDARPIFTGASTVKTAPVIPVSKRVEARKKAPEIPAPTDNIITKSPPKSLALQREKCTDFGMLITQPCEGGVRLVGCRDRELRELILPPEITEIGDKALYGFERLRKFKASKGLRYIGIEAFFHCWQLTEADFPAETNVAARAFMGCPLTHANLHYAVFEGAYAESGVRTVSFHEKDGHGVYELKRCVLAKTALESVHLPDSLRSIGAQAFYACLKLREIEPGKNVTYMGEAAFASCESLREFVFPKGVSGVPEKCFYFCRRLEKVQLSEATGEIGASAFYACHALRELVIPRGIYRIGKEAVASDALERVIFKGRRYEEVARQFGREWLLMFSPRVQIVCEDKTVTLTR